MSLPDALVAPPPVPLGHQPRRTRLLVRPHQRLTWRADSPSRLAASANTMAPRLSPQSAKGTGRIHALAASVCVVIIFDPRHIKDWWVPVFCLAAGLAWLLSFKQEPPERKPTVAWAVIHGLWDQLEKEGLPSDEIERLKRLTPEERAGLMAVIMKPVYKYNHPRIEDFGPGGKYNPFDLSLYNPWNDD